MEAIIKFTEEDVEARVEKAVSLFKSGYTCTQSVFIAYSDCFGVDETIAMKFTGPFGGGMGRLREVCGCVSAMVMIAGFIYPLTDPGDKEMKKKNYALVQEFAEKYRKKNGAIVCRELLSLPPGKDIPEPSPRTAEYYSRRPCAVLVGSAARIVGEYLAGLQ